MIQSVVNCQAAYARALIVDARRCDRPNTRDVLGGHRVLTEAFETDIRPAIARSAVKWVGRLIRLLRIGLMSVFKTPRSGRGVLQGHPRRVGPVARLRVHDEARA